MSRLWNPSVRALQPYTPGEQPKLTNLTKLNTNESPYGPSPKAIEAIKDAASDTLRLYPDPTSQGLRQAIAECYDVGVENIFPGNGSDEVLAHVFRALFILMNPFSSAMSPMASILFTVRCSICRIG